ncbi:MAG: hypothetical protein MR598_04570 [Erysipelotrichaceae bacterium]|nr:hypothetical protein [Erysipelotrichaceae bacterium]
MDFTIKDKKEIKESYQLFLTNLKNFITKNDYHEIEKVFKIIRYLLENSYFTDKSEMMFDGKYPYLALPIELSEGVQVMNGICCCRHATELLNDLLNLLNYDSKMLYIFVDTENIWHRQKNGCHANHLVTSIKKENTELILDLENDFLFTVDSTGNIINLKTELTLQDRINCEKYQDKENIKRISKVLKKYYSLRNLGITHIYEEEKYGES